MYGQGKNWVHSMAVWALWGKLLAFPEWRLVQLRKPQTLSCLGGIPERGGLMCWAHYSLWPSVPLVLNLGVKSESGSNSHFPLDFQVAGGYCCDFQRLLVPVLGGDTVWKQDLVFCGYAWLGLQRKLFFSFSSDFSQHIFNLLTCILW